MLRDWWYNMQHSWRERKLRRADEKRDNGIDPVRKHLIEIGLMDPNPRPLEKIIVEPKIIKKEKPVPEPTPEPLPPPKKAGVESLVNNYHWPFNKEIT